MSETNPPRSSAKNWLWPLACALLCLGIGSAAALYSQGGDNEWYQTLTKPAGTPPSWVFGPVWSVLYLLMGIALGRLIVRKAWSAVWVFFIQFVLNLMWTPVFFGFGRIDAALAVIAAIWLGVIATMQLAGKADKLAAWLLVPYLLWVSYASYLNAAFFWLNVR